MKKLLLLFLTAAAVVSAGEFDFSNSRYQLTFDTKGGMLTKLICDEELSITILIRICEHLNCDMEDIVSLEDVNEAVVAGKK